jgi:general secretion pathway protein E
MKIYDEIIDFNFLSGFDIFLLEKSLVLPIKQDGIYFKCFVCEESQIEKLKINSVIKSYKIKKNDIEFFLNDIDIRLKLYKLSIRTNKKDNLDYKYMDEFFEIFIKKAISSRCSDIHIEALEKSLIIRFRIDGSLKIFYVFVKEFFYTLSSYIKMKSKLDITNSRLSQDGRFTFKIDSKTYDFRVSTMPTINGESIVIRVLDNLNVNKSFDTLGFSSHILDSLKNILKLKEGLVLIAGPTGSGKSTTLYSIIKEFNSENKKLMTIEDPVEYKIEQVQQIQIHDAIGLSFNTVLKNILRQDPDIILIGEIRDEFSLNIALQASLTGHLVFASIHANSSVETISRLLDLNADKYLLSTTLKYVISQRLVLNICKECASKGCPKCNFSGFYDRSCISEVLKIDEHISSQILHDSYIKDINSYLKSISFKNILEDGKQKVEKGITTLDEVYKVVGF